MQERAERQKMLKRGVDMLDQNSEITVGKGGGTLGCWQRVSKLIAHTIDIITPLRQRTKLIQLQEDKSVASLFVTFRFLIRISMIALLGFLPLFIG